MLLFLFIIVEGGAIPQDVLDYEKDTFQKLAKLYTLSLSDAPTNRILRYGGVEHLLSSFHYRSNSTVFDNVNKKGSKKLEFIDVNEDAPIIYRWEVKGALATLMKKRDGKMQHRVFTPFTIYKSKHVADQYTCLATMNVRCSSRRFDFLMKRVGSTQTAELWQGLDRMKHFYACPHIAVDHAAVKVDRLLYWDTWQHTYKEERLVLLDTRYPSNKNLPPEKPEIVKERYDQWTIYPGRLKPLEETMLLADTLLASRATRKAEEKAMKASIQRTKQIEALILAEESVPTTTEEKGVKQSSTRTSKKVRTSKVRTKKDVADIPKVSNPSATKGNTNASMQRQIDQLMAELAEEKKKTSMAVKAVNSSTSVVRYQEEKEISPASKRIADLEKAAKEEELKLSLVAKKRKLAEDEHELAEYKAAKKKLKLESMSYASQLLREGELERVKIKVQADQIQADHAQRQQNRAEEDRRRQADYDDSKRRQQMQFASDEHAVMMEKERARIKSTDSITQHNNMMQLIALSQRHHDLSLIMNHATPQQDSTDFTHLGGLKKSSKSSPSQKRSTCSSADPASILQDLKRQLQEEKDLRENIKKGAADIAKYAAEDSDEDGEVDSSDGEEDGSVEDEE
jgi:hypothetical protein